MNKKINKKSISSGKTTSRVTKKKKKRSPTPVRSKSPKECCPSDTPCKSPKTGCPHKKATTAHMMDEVIRMSSEDMARVDLARTKLALIMESVKVRDLQKERLEWESQARTAKLTQEKFSLESQQVKLQGELELLLDELSPKYNMDLKKCAYDDEGVIRKIED
jgi:hypothetical protein